MKDLLLIGPATPEMLARLGEKFTVHDLFAQEDRIGWLKAHGQNIEFIATNGHDGVKPEYMELLPNIKIISCYGVGYDAVDTDEAVRRGIVVTHTPNVLNAEVATTAVMLMLACYRNLLTDDAHARSGRWEKDGNAPLSRSADGQTVGIVGLGRIGQAIAEKLAPFGTRILYHSRSEKPVAFEYFPDLQAMAKEADVLICITPGGPATNKLVSRDVIHALGPQGTLINVSRGTVVDEAAMVEALQSGALGWAGLDVFEHEPHIPEALKAMSNVVLLPHVGSATIETRAAMGNLTVDNLLNFLHDGTVISAVPECAGL